MASQEKIKSNNGREYKVAVKKSEGNGNRELKPETIIPQGDVDLKDF